MLPSPHSGFTPRISGRAAERGARRHLLLTVHSGSRDAAALNGCGSSGSPTKGRDGSLLETDAEPRVRRARGLGSHGEVEMSIVALVFAVVFVLCMAFFTGGGRQAVG